MVRTYPHFNPFSVADPSSIDWNQEFQQDNPFPLYLEIGCSNGRWMLDFAKKYPKKNIVGVETRNKYVEALKDRIKDSELTNIMVIRANINTALSKLFDKGQLQDVFIMFPDPWYKKKHLKRRVVKDEFLEELYSIMNPGSLLHIATDKKEFAYEMLETLTESSFKNTVKDFAEVNIDGLVTEIESFHLHRQNPVYRMVFERA